MLLLTVILGFVPFSLGEKLSYDDYSLYKLIPSSDVHVNVLSDLFESSKEYEFWVPPSKIGEFVSVVSPPDSKENLEELIITHGIPGGIVVENIEE